MPAIYRCLAVALAAACTLDFFPAPPGLLAWAEEPAREAAPEADPEQQALALVAAMRSTDPDARAEAALQAADNQAACLTSPLVRLLADKDDGVRTMATRALATRSEPAARKKAANSIVARLPRLAKLPVDRAELMESIDALRLLQQPSSIKPLLDPIDGDMELEEASARLQAVAGIPDKESIERLIQFLAKGRRGGRQPQRAAAEKALRWATGERFGTDPDKWRAWWRENEKSFSFSAVTEAREAAEQEKREKAEQRKKQREEKRKNRPDKKKEDGPPPAPSD